MCSSDLVYGAGAKQRKAKRFVAAYLCGTGIAGTGQAAPVFSGAEPEFKKLKQRIIQAAKSFARYRRTALTDRATENQNRTVGKRESAMAGINAEAEQREQLIAETEQRIADLKQQIEKAREIDERFKTNRSSGRYRWTGI